MTAACVPGKGTLKTLSKFLPCEVGTMIILNFKMS